MAQSSAGSSSLLRVGVSMRIVFLLCAVAGLACGGAAPDQVLVLYNADWTEDLDGTEPGQDSLEVARYYVEQRTDPKTGKKPYLLGLTCRDPKARRLDQMRLPEDSQDNKLGLRLKKDGSQPKSPPWSATHIVLFRVSDVVKKLDPASLTIKISTSGKEEDAKVAYAQGKAQPGLDIREIKWGKDQVGYGFASGNAFPDGFTAWVKCATKDGKPFFDFSARYSHPDHFTPDFAGPDGVRDDANYLADIEDPIKRFLEARRNRLPGGTLLKDHILYMVVCYGLPKQVESSFGVVRGVGGHCGGGDDGSALESRLALMYHNVARYHFPVVLPRSHRVVRSCMITSRLRASLGGANPFRHPKTHQRRRGKGLVGNRLYKSYEYEAPRIPHFTTAVRRMLGDRFLYVATRIDGRHPEIAKAQVDGALYGSRHLTPELGWFWHGTYSSAPQAVQELEFLGFRGKPPAVPKPHGQGRVLFYFGDFGYSVPCAPDAAKPPVPYSRGFYPGSVGYAVRSGLGWRLRRGVSQLYNSNSRYLERMLEAGVTVCALSAHGAHDTSATWPDDQVFFHHLLRGYDLGEAFLISGIYLDWVQSHVGDPLYRPALRDTVPDATPPRVASRDDIAIELGKADGRYYARVRPKLAVSPDNPEMTDIAVAYWRTPADKRTASHWRFSRRPHVVLRGLEPNAAYHYDLVLTDPYGNRFSSAKAFGDLTLKTGPAPAARRVLAHWREAQGGRAGPSIAIGGRSAGLLPDRGEVHIEFTPQKTDFGLVDEGRRHFIVTCREFVVGGQAVAFCPPPGKKPPPIFAPGRRYRLIVRWRRDPVVRQAVLVARDGREFELGSNSRLCWRPVELGSHLRVRHAACAIHAITVYDDTQPRPPDRLYPLHFDLDGFNAADAPPGTANPPGGPQPPAGSAAGSRR